MLAVLVMNAILAVISILLIVAEKFLVTYGECKITINKEKVLTVIGGNNLLSCFAEHKLFIPSACGGKSTCGYCKVEVLSGGGGILPTEKVFISYRERLKGVRLACQVKVKNDLEVLIAPELLAAQEFKVTVERITDLTPDIKHVFLRLKSPAEIKFKPGQYVQFQVPQTDEFRAYSIASVPSQNNMVELVVRLIPNGLCSSYIHEILDAGDNIVLTGPFGDFYLREESAHDIICVGGGCGMAPIRSILYHLKEKGMPRKVMYFFGARSKKDLFFSEELFALSEEFSNFRYIPALSEPRPEDNWHGEVGLITQVMQKHLKYNKNQEAYLCGPPPMIDAAIVVLTSKGVNINEVYYDKF